MDLFETFADECAKNLSKEIEKILKLMQGEESCSIGFITTDDCQGFYLTWNGGKDIEEFYDWEEGTEPDFLYQPVVNIVNSHEEIDFCSPNEEKWNFIFKLLGILEEGLNNIPEEIYRTYGFNRDDVQYFASMSDGDYCDKMMEYSLEIFNNQNVIPDKNVLEQLIGCWQSEGWGFILCEQVELVPFVHKVLTDIGAEDMLAAFEKVTACFPEGTVFENTDEYYDVFNFMQTYSYKVQDEKLKAMPSEQRRTLVKQFRKCLDELDEITENYWNA